MRSSCHAKLCSNYDSGLTRKKSQPICGTDDSTAKQDREVIRWNQIKVFMSGLNEVTRYCIPERERERERRERERERERERSRKLYFTRIVV